MTDEPAPVVIPDVPPTALQQQLKGQVRIWVAFAAGSLLGHHIVPAALAPLVNDTLLDVATGSIMVVAMAAWSWLRARLIHSRFWALATNPDVPDTIVKPAAPLPAP